ncbi:MAG: hypothetical protein AAGD25_37120 [Cyanobacteria bacterium P01_F01_bin.150]
MISLGKPVIGTIGGLVQKPILLQLPSKRTQLSPNVYWAIIHRDIKPANLICEIDPDNDQVIKNIYLVDFGAVQDAYNKTIVIGTVVGTYGYMAPEQFRGKVTLATDLYSLGMTLLFLLSHRNPDEFPQKNFKIQFRDKAKLSALFAQWLEKLLEPDSGDRFTSASVALKRLNYLSRAGAGCYYPEPLKTTVRLKQTHKQLKITIPMALPRPKFELKHHLLPLIWNILFPILLIRLCFIFPALWFPCLLLGALFGIDILMMSSQRRRLYYFSVAVWASLGMGYHLMIPLLLSAEVWPSTLAAFKFYGAWVGGLAAIAMRLAQDSRADKICRNIMELMLKDAVEFHSARDLAFSKNLEGFVDQQNDLRYQKAEKVWQR